MRMTATTPQVTHGSGLPRGWIILGLTLALPDRFPSQRHFCRCDDAEFASPHA